MKQIDCEELKNVSKIHMIGIGGVSMSGIAIMLKRSGFDITGSDAQNGDMISVLRDEGIDVFIGNNPERVHDKDMVVYTAAINKKTDTEYLEAQRLNICTIERAPFLGILLKMYKNRICVAGMHGKTTTTSMIASAFNALETEPTVLVGSKLKELGNVNYMIGDANYFILESCEYVDSFLNFPPTTAVILNIEEEHLDYFKGIEHIKESFTKFILMLPQNGSLVINYDDVNSMDILKNIKTDLDNRNIRICTYSLSNTQADIYADNISIDKFGFYNFDVYIKEEFLTHINLKVHGKHNILNILATIGSIYVNNLDAKAAKASLEGFTGASRRFEFKKDLPNHVVVYDDYAHHPTEIKVTIESAKECPHNKIIAVFEPHTYTRTKEFLNDFSESFHDADVVIIPDIYSAREVDDGTISSKMLVDKLVQNNINAKYISGYDNIVKYILDIVEPNDIILTIGAGPITKLSDLL